MGQKLYQPEMKKQHGGISRTVIRDILECLPYTIGTFKEQSRDIFLIRVAGVAEGDADYETWKAGRCDVRIVMPPYPSLRIPNRFVIRRYIRFVLS